MDAQQFDRLAQQFSRVLSRRRIGAVLAALGLGAGLGAVPDAEAKKKKKKKKRCKNGAVKCGSACVDAQTNAQHCGGCGRRCQSGQPCVGGECQTGGCAGDRELCAGACVNLDNDDLHCGACGVACDGDLTCLSGDCGCASGTKCGNACVDTQSDRRHCGGCGDACTGNQACTGGECVEPPECVTDYQCGGYTSWNDLVCRNGRCVCDTAGHGICRRFSDGGGSCHQCCPGGNGECRFDEICFYRDSPAGRYGLCDCPTGWQRCNYNPWPTGTCVQDPMTDSRKCGSFCEDCTANTTFPAICCGGSCTRGCNPGQLCFNQNQPCGPNCLPCNSDSICCNMGPGTLPRCIPNAQGNVCYQN